jgi:hypothetical protein
MELSLGRIRKTNSKWQDLKVKRYFAWVYLDCLANHVRQRVILLIVLQRIIYRNFFVVIMVDRTQTTSALKIEQGEVVLRNKIIHMTAELNSYVL